MVVIDGVIDQIGIIAGFEDLNCPVAVCKEAKVHHGASLDCAIIDAYHLDRKLGVSLALQLKFIRGGIQPVFYAGVEEVKVSFIVQIPGTK